MKILSLTPKIQKAIIRATKLHWNQIRKGDGLPYLPYIIHPYSVAFIVSRYTIDEDTIAAAFLHDVLEDVKKEEYNDKQMIKEFGQNVFNIVKGVSEEKDASITKKEEKATWEERKRKYLERLRHDSEGSLIVCAADKIHNLQSMIDAYKVQGDKLFSKFNSPANKKLWFYGEVLKILKDKLNNKIVKELELVFKEASAILIHLS